jgi:hypothetical protein
MPVIFLTVFPLDADLFSLFRFSVFLVRLLGRKPTETLFRPLNRVSRVYNMGAGGVVGFKELLSD